MVSPIDSATPVEAAATSDGAIVLARPEWEQLQNEYRSQVDEVIGDYLHARRVGARHPVIDFLFTYYASRPSHIVDWHPGFGVTLERGERFLRTPGYHRTEHGVTADPAYLIGRSRRLRESISLSRAIASRRARLGCFGLHEWAMVYRSTDVRHDLPLRLTPTQTDAVVESMPLRCTHFDAFRFFTEPARPRNDKPLTRDTQFADEQPGCLHATMDLYRTCLRLRPLLPSSLTLAAFTLALTARELDMCASPYDLRSLGYAPVAVETPTGRAEYVRRQSRIAEDGRLLRERVLRHCEVLEAAATRYELPPPVTGE